ncbi:MAG: hypothetical protein WB439_13300 [Acidobacteriaceae bacterium]
MSPRLARIVTRLYPQAWRARYGEEFVAMLELGPGDLRVLVNSVGLALQERIFPTQGGSMDGDSNSFGVMIRRPSAFVPVAMSLIALVTVLAALAMEMHTGGHIVRSADEGSVAHIWQILMTVQMPVVLYFLVKWLRRAPAGTLEVFALQAGVWLASCAPIYFLHL